MFTIAPLDTIAKTSILIAPAAFKGSLSAIEVAECLSDALAHTGSFDATDLIRHPIADGGDDTLATLAFHNHQWRQHHAEVTGPLAETRVLANWLYMPETHHAVVEAAQAHGITRLPSGALEPLRSTSYGVGELIGHVLAHYPQTRVLSVTLGGSASTDGGAGCLQALGYTFRDHFGVKLAEPLGGGDLSQIAHIEQPAINSKLWPEKLTILTDVTNPLLGPLGSASVYGPQKGADSQQVSLLEAGLYSLAQQLYQVTGLVLANKPGVGAAGGLAFGLSHLPNSRIKSGAAWFQKITGLKDLVNQASLVITGEGCLDATSFNGKGTGELIRLAGNKPVIVLCGKTTILPVELPPHVHVITLPPPEELRPSEQLNQAFQQALPLIHTLLGL